MLTRREELQELILDNAMTPHDLARATSRRVASVVDDLEHLRRSLGQRLRVDAAVCDPCGFVFRKRARIAPPSRCPVCREERISGPWVSLKQR